MDFAPPRLAAWLGRLGLALGITAAFVLWSNSRGDRPAAEPLNTLRYSIVLAYGAATWVSTRRLKRPVPLKCLLGLGMASLAATTWWWFQPAERSEVLFWKILNACALAEIAATVNIAFAVPVVWATAMACHDFGPDSRRLATNRIGAKVTLAGIALQLTAIGVSAAAFYGWNLHEFESWGSVILRVFSTISFACAGWAAWISLSLRTAEESLRPKALRIHRLNLISIAARFPMMFVWIGTRLDGFPHSFALGCTWFLIPPLLRLVFTLHLRAFWAPSETGRGL